jgi:RHS repeat-associated protein
VVARCGSLQTVSYCYDGAGRLTSVNGVSGCSGASTSSYSYAPSAAGDNCASLVPGANPGEGANTNRTSVTTPAGTTGYCYNTADQLVASITGGTASTSYAYNEHGDQTDDNGTSYTWDSSDRPVTATTPGGTTTSTYDAVSRLIQSSSSTGSTARYAYAGYSDTPVAVLDTSNNILQQLVSLPGGVTVTLQPAGSIWSYVNLQGDVAATASAAGSRTAGPFTYDPWGNLSPGQAAPAVTSGPDTLGAYATSGKLTNSATATILLGARTFNPAEARFLSVDPVDGGCANAYVYAYGDPLNHGDLTGQHSCGDVAKNVEGIVIGVVSFVAAVAALAATDPVIGLIFAVLAFVTGTLAVVFDAQDCLDSDFQDVNACTGAILGAVGALAGGLSAAGAAAATAEWIAENGIPDIAGKAVGAAGLSVGGAAVAVDTGAAHAACEGG